MAEAPRPWGKFLLRLAASAAMLGVVATFVDRQRALDGFRRLSTGMWILALAAFVVLHLLSALKWRAFVVLAGSPIPRTLALRCHAAGLFGNLCLPSLIGGDVVRAGLALKSASSRAGLVVASVIDRISDVTALLGISLVALLCVGIGETTPLRALPVAAAALAACMAGGTATLWWLVRSRVVRRLPRKVARTVIGAARAFRTMLRRPVRSARIWLASVAIQSGFVLVNVELGRAMGLDLTYGQWFLLWPLAKIAAMIPVSFGGLGVREAAFAALVAPFGPESVAVAVSLVWQSVLIVGGLLAGGFWVTTSRGTVPREAVA